MRAHIKEEALGFDEFFSNFNNFAPSRNGGHLEMRNFRNVNTIDIPETHSRFSAMETRTDANEGSNQRGGFGLWRVFLRFLKFFSVAERRLS